MKKYYIDATVDATFSTEADSYEEAIANVECGWADLENYIVSSVDNYDGDNDNG